MSSKPFTWSWSQLEKFEQCPRAWYHQYVLKEKQPSSPALEHGKELHKACEDFMNDKNTTKAIPNFEMVQSVYRASRHPGIETLVEYKMGLTRNLQPCEFFGDSVSGRCATDVTLINSKKAWLGDWKSGKVREKDDQVMIQALFTFERFPEIDYIVANNLWLEAGKVGKTYEFYRNQKHEYWQRIIPRLQKMEQAWVDHVSTPRPSYLCGYCPVSTCEHKK